MDPHAKESRARLLATVGARLRHEFSELVAREVPLDFANASAPSVALEHASGVTALRAQVPILGLRVVSLAFSA